MNQKENQQPMTTHRNLPPHAARLIRLASLINDEQLPPAQLSIQADGQFVAVHALGVPNEENVVRRWAHALDLPVDVVPSELPDGTAADTFIAAGVRDGVTYMVSGKAAVPAVWPATA